MTMQRPGNPITTDVLIVGNGLSGLLLSLLLQRAGIDHRLLAKRQPKAGPALGETLPPATLVLLHQLGLLPLFESAASKTYGYHALWGTAAVQSTHFFHHRPFGYGLKLDKPALLSRLAQLAQEPLFADQTDAPCAEGDRWSLCYTQAGQSKEIKARLLVDATGRNRALVRKLSTIEHHDQQLAFTCHLPLIRHPELKHGVFTELLDWGWGMVSRLNAQQQVMTLFTDKAHPLCGQLKKIESWSSLLANSRYLRQLLPSEHSARVFGAEAGSSIAKAVTGRNWLAIGDAAMAFDPLSSHGNSNAIWCAQAAAQAIKQELYTPQTEAFTQYSRTVQAIFAQYLQHRQQLHRVAS